MTISYFNGLIVVREQDSVYYAAWHIAGAPASTEGVGASPYAALQELLERSTKFRVINLVLALAFTGNIKEGG